MDELRKVYVYDGGMKIVIGGRYGKGPCVVCPRGRVEYRGDLLYCLSYLAGTGNKLAQDHLERFVDACKKNKGKLK